MKNIGLSLLLFAYMMPTLAQGDFKFVKSSKKIHFPFKLINNLVFIPIKVNGVELTFLLDSGVEQTVLFSLHDKTELNFKDVEKVLLRGLGSEDVVEGLRAKGNLLEVNGMQSKNHELYIILDQSFNFSSHVGIPVNGIIGYAFFKNNIVGINYEKKRITVYADNKRNRKRMERRYKKIPISIESSKPYVEAAVVLSPENVIDPAKLLVDVGNSDSVWLFQDISDRIKVPEKNFDDYLGQGFSGKVLGKRALISEFLISDFKFKKPIAAFPDSSSIRHLRIVPDRLGSVGGDILKRFSIVLDYIKSDLYLRKNSSYKDPFTYNKSGIEIQHLGMNWVKETVQLQTVPEVKDKLDTIQNGILSGFMYNFQLMPIYEIIHLRKDSPAAKSGLQNGDRIISINQKPANKYSLQQILQLLKPEDEKWLTILVERKEELLEFRFQLVNVLE